MPRADGLLADGAKLNPEQQHQVCEWFAQFYNATQIQRMVQDKFNKTVAHCNIWNYSQSPKWRPLIERLRQQWALSIMDVPLAHKRSRLEKLVLLLERAERNADVSEYRKVAQCMDLLHEMRDEMEAGKTQFTNVYMTTIHNYSDEEIVKRREEVLERLKKLKVGGSDGQGHGRQITLEASTTSPEGTGAPLRDGVGSDDQGREGPRGGCAPTGSGGRSGVDEGVSDASQVGETTPVHGDATEQEALGQEDPGEHVRGPAEPLREGESRVEAV